MSRGILSKLSFASLLLWFVAMLHCAHEQALAHCDGHPLSRDHAEQEHGRAPVEEDQHPDLCELPCLRSTAAAVAAPSAAEISSSLLPLVSYFLTVPDLKSTREDVTLHAPVRSVAESPGVISLTSAPNAPPRATL